MSLIKVTISTLIIIALTSLLKLNAQQYLLHGLHDYNTSLLNPAFSGSKINSELTLTHKQYWKGINNAPTIQTVAFNTLLETLPGKRSKNYRIPGTTKGNEGIGFVLSQDRRSAISRLNGQINYSHHIKLTKERNRLKPKPNLALSIAVGVSQFVLDESHFRPLAGFDPIVDYNIEKTIIPFINYGMLLYDRNYYVGFSVNYLTSKKYAIEDATETSDQIPAQFVWMSAVSIKVNEDVSVAPSLFAQYNNTDEIMVELGSRLMFKNLMCGFAYRYNKELIFQAGIDVGRYSVAYAYDYSTSGLAAFGGGSHEVMFKVLFGKLTPSFKMILN